MKRWVFIRDILLFIFGLAGLAYQLIFAPVVEPTLTVVFSAMIGLPAVIWGDDYRKKRGSNGQGAE